MGRPVPFRPLFNGTPVPLYPVHSLEKILVLIRRAVSYSNLATTQSAPKSPLTLCSFFAVGVNKVCRELCDAVRVVDLEEMKKMTSENKAEVVQAWSSKDDDGFKAMTAR